MNTFPRPGTVRVVVLLLLLCVASAAGVASSPASAADDTATGPDAARDYTVFLGLELTLDDAARPTPILWADREHLEVLRDGEVVRLPRRTAALKSTLVPRLGHTRLTVDKLQGRRRYSYTNDPERAALAEHLALQSAQDDARQAAELRRYQAEGAVRQLAAQGSAGRPVPAGAMREATARMQEATQALESTYASPQFDPELSDPTTGGVADDGSGGNFDAFEATFAVSAPQEMRDVHVVLRLFIRDPTQPDLVAPVHRFFRVKVIGPEPRRLSLLQDRLPQGYAIDSFSVHFFRGTEELPTTASRNRLDVSAEEAHQFLVLQHVQERRTSQVPIAIIPALLPRELRALIPEHRRDATVEFTVDAGGRVVAIAPSRTEEPFSRELVDALRRVRFLPAVTGGRAVTGTGHFALSEFAP